MQPISVHFNGPAMWAELLAQVDVVFPGSVIAGGACRDYMFKIAPKDLDVFVISDSREDFEARVLELNAGDFDLRLFDFKKDFDDNPDTVDLQRYAEWSGKQLFGVAEGSWKGMAVNIIGRVDLKNGIETLVKNFDMGICMIGWEQGRWFMADKFLQDFDSRMATVNRERDPARAKERFDRFDRFNARNPGLLMFVEPKYEYQDFDDILA